MRWTRRNLLSLFAFVGLTPHSAMSGDADQKLQSETLRFAAGAPVAEEQHRLRIDGAAPSGYAVPVEIDLGSPLEGAAGDARRATLVAPLNPQPRVLSVELGPMATGRVATRIRLARSQTVRLLVRRADGAVVVADAPVDVLVGGCGFDLPAGESAPG